MVNIGCRSTQHLSHRLYKAQKKKERRRYKRQQIARAHTRSQSETSDDNNSPSPDVLREEEEEGARVAANNAWLERERVAQEEFALKLKVQHEIEEKKRQIKEEWERLQKKFRKKEPLAVTNDGGESDWHNPYAPEDAEYTLPSSPPRNSRTVEPCLLFLKTGCCRFFTSCSRCHPPVLSSGNCVLFTNMYSHYALQLEASGRRDKFDADHDLEYSLRDAQVHYETEFYPDVLPEFSKFGQIVQFKTCCNSCAHLRGNVYVQYSSEDSAKLALEAMHCRFYSGRQLIGRLVNIPSWRQAICGLSQRGRCSKGGNCNYLHVFENPAGKFHNADQHFGRLFKRGFKEYQMKSPKRWSQVRSPVRYSRSRSRSPKRLKLSHRESPKHLTLNGSSARKYFTSTDSFPSDSTSRYSQSPKHFARFELKELPVCSKSKDIPHVKHCISQDSTLKPYRPKDRKSPKHSRLKDRKSPNHSRLKDYKSPKHSRSKDSKSPKHSRSKNSESPKHSRSKDNKSPKHFRLKDSESLKQSTID